MAFLAIYASGYPSVIKTRAAMFRYGSKDETDTKKCEEDEVLQKYHKQIKLTEFMGALLSLAALVGILILWQIDGFDVGTVPDDMRDMKTWWQKTECTPGGDADGQDFQSVDLPSGCCFSAADNSDAYKVTDSRSCLMLPPWDAKFTRERERVQQWMNGSNYASQKDGCTSAGNGGSNACNNYDYKKFLMSYDNTPVYPATVWLYDVASFRWQNQLTSVGASAALTSTDTGNGWGVSAYTEGPAFAVYKDNDMVEDTILNQCDKKYKSYKVFEKYDDYSYAVQDRVLNNYKVNMWGVLVFIYLTSFLFQIWRAYEYGFEYRPLQADGVRWVEYGITAPLMIFIIAISAGIREVSLLVILVFAQAALMGLGYVLESFQDEYLLWAKYCMYARVQGGFSTAAGSESLKLRFGAEENDKGSTTTLVGGKDATAKVPVASAVTTLDDFLEVIQRPANCANNNFNLLSKIAGISSKKRMVLDVFYLGAFTLFGVIWTIIIVHLIRASYTLSDCTAGADAKMPLIVWLIVGGQAGMFLSFGVVSAYTWLFRVKPLHARFKTTGDLDGRARESLTELRKQGQLLWVQASWYYAILNIVSKTYLEVTIFFYVAMYKSTMNA